MLVAQPAQLALPLPGLEPPLHARAPLPDPRRRIYCNRSLRLDQVEWVGFDMDYTLAIYRQDAIDRLSIEATARKLVARGYPDRLLHMRYRTDFPVRGLLVDRKLGNVLKMDRYRYVKRAYHGMRPLTKAERRRLYHSRRLRPGSARYHWVDTLFGLPEVSLYAAVIEALEGEGEERLDYERLFDDVRECIDLAHRDGSILDEVVGQLPRYIERDPDLGRTLHALRSSGKRLFLLTNSFPENTERIMSYLLDDALSEYPSWRHYFDVAISHARKPSFFTGDESFEEVLPDGRRRGGVEAFERGRLYAGGNLADLERMLGAGGPRVLYVGDHIYGDAMRVKKESAWRTVMVLQEMVAELEALERCREPLERMDRLDALRDELHAQLREAQLRLRRVQRRVEAAEDRDEPPAAHLLAERTLCRRAIDRLRGRLREAEREHERLEEQVDSVFHPFWGSLFKAGPEVSSFGDQVEEFACLYTSRVSNFLRYSPMHFFRSPRDRMPHEL